MPLSLSRVDRRIPEALSTSRGKPAGFSDGNWIQTMPGKGWNTILRLYNPLEAFFFDKSWRPMARSSLSTDAEARRQVNPAVLGGISIHVVALLGLGRAAVAAPIVRDHAVTLFQEEQYLVVPVVGAERPAVEDTRLF